MRNATSGSRVNTVTSARTWFCHSVNSLTCLKSVVMLMQFGAGSGAEAIRSGLICTAYGNRLILLF